MAVTNNKSTKSASTKLASDLATAKAKTTGMDTSRINSAGTYQELSRISKGSRKPTDLLPPGYKEGVGIEPTPTVAPIEAPTPTVAPIQEPPQANAGVITPQEALKNAQASGTPPPQDSGEARSQLGKFMPSDKGFYKLPNDPNPDQVYDATGKKLSYDEYIARGGNPDFSGIQMGVPENAITRQIEENPDYQAVLQAKKEAFDVLNQRASLTDEYKKLTKQLGINEINTELMNMKNVIEGTEDDLRTEITKAGGFATESQVQALTMARNKQLVKNYNNLLETKQMAMETLNTMIGLAAQDRQFAQQAAMQKLNIEQDILNYKDRMRQNAQSQYEKLASTVGYKGLLSMTGGDPWKTALIEKTLGLQPGGLAQLASIPGERDTQVVTAGGRSLLIDTQTGETIKDLGGAYKTGGGGGGSRSSGSTTSNVETQYNDLINYWKEAGIIQGNGTISSIDYKRAKAAWLLQGKGFTEAQFDDLFAEFVDSSGENWRKDYGLID